MINTHTQEVFGFKAETSKEFSSMKKILVAAITFILVMISAKITDNFPIPVALIVLTSVIYYKQGGELAVIEYIKYLAIPLSIVAGIISFVLLIKFI